MDERESLDDRIYERIRDELSEREEWSLNNAIDYALCGRYE